MRILFAIAVLSCCALVWAAISIARHIKKSRNSSPQQADASSGPGLWEYADPPPTGGRRPLHPRNDLAAGNVASRSNQDQT